MPYSAFIALAIVIHLIINFDTLRSKRSESIYALRPFKVFLTAIFFIYITDLLWDIFSDNHLAIPLYVDMVCYFICMGATVYCWARFQVRFLDAKRSARLAVEGIGFTFMLAETNSPSSLRMLPFPM